MQTPFDPSQTGLADKTAGSIDRLSAGAHQAVDKTTASVDRLSTGAHQAVDKFAQAAATAAEQIGHRAEQMRAQQMEWTEAARACVRRHPMASIGIAVGVGVLLSMFNGRSTRH